MMEPNEIAGLARRVHDAEQWKLGASSSRETRNAFWARVVGIVHHGHPVYNATPDPRWHLKSGGGGRPQSDDVAVRMPDRHFWDFIGGVGADGYSFGASSDHGALPPEQPVFPPPVPDGVGVAVPPAAPSEYWTAAHDAIRVRMAGRSVRELAEQLAHAFPGESWGEKRTSGGSWSADTIGRLVGGQLWAIKVVPSVKVYGFLDASHVHRSVAAVNHLGDGPVNVPPPPVEPPPVEPPPSTPAVDYGPRFDILDANVGELMAMVTRLAATVSTLQATALALQGQKYDINVPGTRFTPGIKGTVTPQAPTS